MSDPLPKAQPVQQAAVEDKLQDEVQSLEDGMTDAQTAKAQKELKRLTKEVARKERRKIRKQMRKTSKDQETQELEGGKEISLDKSRDSNKAGLYKRVNRHADNQDDKIRQDLVDDPDTEYNPDSVKDQDDESNPDSVKDQDDKNCHDSTEDEDSEKHLDVEYQDQGHEDPLLPCNAEQEIPESNASILAPCRTQSATLRTSSHRPNLPHVDWLNKPISADPARTPPQTPTESIDTPAEGIDNSARSIDNQGETTIPTRAPQTVIPLGIRVLWQSCKDVLANTLRIIRLILGYLCGTLIGPLKNCLSILLASAILYYLFLFLWYQLHNYACARLCGHHSSTWPCNSYCSAKTISAPTSELSIWKPSPSDFALSTKQFTKLLDQARNVRLLPHAISDISSSVHYLHLSYRKAGLVKLSNHLLQFISVSQRLKGMFRDFNVGVVTTVERVISGTDRAAHELRRIENQPTPDIGAIRRGSYWLMDNLVYGPIFGTVPDRSTPSAAEQSIAVLKNLVDWVVPSVTKLIWEATELQHQLETLNQITARCEDARKEALGNVQEDRNQIIQSLGLLAKMMPSRWWYSAELQIPEERLRELDRIAPTFNTAYVSISQLRESLQQIEVHAQLVRAKIQDQSDQRIHWKGHSTEAINIDHERIIDEVSVLKEAHRQFINDEAQWIKRLFANS